MPFVSLLRVPFGYLLLTSQRYGVSFFHHEKVILGPHGKRQEVRGNLRSAWWSRPFSTHAR